MNDIPLLEARELTKSFTSGTRRTDVLMGVNLTLHSGELASLLGVSGSGKSTLIQILGSLDRPTSGTVFLDGIDVFSLKSKELSQHRNRKIGFIYQFHRLLPEFSATENVAMPLLIGRLPLEQARSRAEEALIQVGLGHRLQHRPGQLSGGEQQRVAIARAIVTRPVLLLADEPTGNLDQETAKQVFSLLRELNRTMRLTCLMVTHNGDLAQQSDRCFSLKNGKLA
ncbi:MAG: ABC transporter ATP-binding protein [Magnetococcales bacterium]|nr:ABC transporter ATP-binding protein [Magnetococcales bacterium]MBF0150009.1 ABC transporter ATP-binding protein [Magnetococcales bacterium]MBF0174236.1 ABC transporter ATP-binding protein [Magnetococcales bacterium]MBF0347764.1 ABC transporter ATP-binding protein [Magnetococcales bacterium]MBF0632881.1 ABC transporter ATP-binding protein [Magnetococcales bacterium]